LAGPGAALARNRDCEDRSYARQAITMDAILAAPITLIKSAIRDTAMTAILRVFDCYDDPHGLRCSTYAQCTDHQTRPVNREPTRRRS
jgi:hypothetical protein